LQKYVSVGWPVLPEALDVGFRQHREAPEIGRCTQAVRDDTEGAVVGHALYGMAQRREKTLLLVGRDPFRWPALRSQEPGQRPEAPDHPHASPKSRR
jgi:hypothetical protein